MPAVKIQHRGIILPYDHSRTIRRNCDSYPYSPNCEVWELGSALPSVCALRRQPGLVREEPARLHPLKFQQFITRRRLEVTDECERLELAPQCEVICGDCRKVLACFVGQVDLIVTSPLYADARRQHYD
ncbi:MAG: hypothetical protein N3B01_12555, partial [Verrucomicrobiae bacterium]|nr:hypothetical protein [Verrucomicrobiae bacterium]